MQYTWSISAHLYLTQTPAFRFGTLKGFIFTYCKCATNLNRQGLGHSNALLWSHTAGKKKKKDTSPSLECTLLTEHASALSPPVNTGCRTERESNMCHETPSHFVCKNMAGFPVAPDFFCNVASCLHLLLIPHTPFGLSAKFRRNNEN